MSPDGPLKPPPEEKLLKLIRGRGLNPVSVESGAATVTAGSSLMSAPYAGDQGGDSQWPRIAIGVLVAVLFIEVICLIFQVIRPLPEIELPRIPNVSGISSGELRSPLEGIPSLSSSLSSPIFASSATTAAPDVSMPSTSASQLAARLTLMGIVAGNPAQAIIEDTGTQKTYFVTKGQTVVEGAILKDVLENGVVLDYGGETIELTL